MSALRSPVVSDAHDSGAATVRAPLGPVLALTVLLAFAAALFVSSVLVLVKHPTGAVVPGLEDQNQGAKTAAYVIAVVLVTPLALVAVPRLLDAIAARRGSDGLAMLTAGLAWGLDALLVAVRLLPHIGVHDGLKEVLVALVIWGMAAAFTLRAALRGTLTPRILPRSGAAVVSVLLVVAVTLTITDVGSLDPLAIAVGIALVVVGFRLAVRPGWRALPRPAGHAVDGLVLLVLLFAVPNVVVFHTGGIPNLFYPPGIIQFHQNWLLGPTNQLLGGGALLVNVPVSQYGVGFIYFLAGWFHIAPIGYGTYGLLDGLVTALFYMCAYGLLRIAGVGRAMAVAAISLAVLAFIYHLYYSIGALPQQGPLRFGLPLAVIASEVAALRWPGAGRWARAAGLLVLAAAAVWSLEMFAYTSATYLALVAFRAWLGPAPRWPSLRGAVILGVGACAAGHVVLAVWTLAATGHLPDWGQYLTYVDALVLGNQAAGQISYGFATFSPGLAVGAAGLASAIAVILVAARAPAIARRDPVRFLALCGLSAYAVVLFSYTDNRSSTYLLPYVSLPLLLAAVLWLDLIWRRSSGVGESTRRAALAVSLSVAGLMLMAAWPTIGPLFSQSALAHAYPGGGLRGALHRLWHAPPIDPRAPVGDALLDRYAPGKRALVLLPDLPDLGTEILMRGGRSNALFIGDPKADGFIDPSAWTGTLSRQIAALRPGARVLTDPAGLLIASELRGRSPALPLHHPIGQFNPQIEWILQRLAGRFSLVPVAHGSNGLTIAQLEPR